MRRPLLLIVTAVALLFTSPGPISTAAPKPPPPPPNLQTGFEQRGGASWTTLEEEATFLQSLDQSSERVTVAEIGRTALGRPLRLTTIGDPAPKSKAAIASGSSIFLICSQHGDEPSGRESCLQTARNLAFSNSGATRALLRNTTVLLLTSANPEGTAADTRENSNDVDINRDHLELATKEGQAMATVIRDYRPDLVHDLHEYGSTPDVYDRQLIHLWPRNRNVDKQVYDNSVELNTDFVAPKVERAGYSTGIYGIWNGPDGEQIAQIAGDGQERILRNMAGLRHSVGILVEANNDPTTPQEEADESALNKRRVVTHSIAVGASFDMFRKQHRQIEAATESSPARATAEGAAGDKPFYFGGGDNELPPSNQVTVDPPCGYRLTAAQYGQIQTALDLHGIAVQQSGATYTVSMAQPAQGVIPLLMDARGQFEVVQAQPLSTC